MGPIHPTHTPPISVRRTLELALRAWGGQKWLRFVVLPVEQPEANLVFPLGDHLVGEPYRRGSDRTEGVGECGTSLEKPLDSVVEWC